MICGTSGNIGGVYTPIMFAFDNGVLLGDGFTWYMLAGQTPDSLTVISTMVFSTPAFTFTMSNLVKAGGDWYVAFQSVGPGAVTRWRSGIEKRTIVAW
jgi:hypothetical protein